MQRRPPGPGGLLEREAELAVLDAVLRAAAGGAGRMAVVEGPPGIGKTALLTTVRARALDENLQVLTARGTELEAEFAFGVVRQLFDAELRTSPAVRRKELFRGAAANAVGLLTGAVTGQPTAPDQTYAMLHSLYWFLVNLCDAGPAAIIVDDAHWADPSSVAFLSFLRPRLSELPLALLLATRPVRQGPAVDLLADTAVTLVRPTELRREAVARIVEEQLGEPHPAFVTSCAHASGGNPFYLTQLLRALVAEGIKPTEENSDRAAQLSPDAITRFVLIRLAALPPDAVSLSRAAAILGEAPLAELAAFAGLPLARAGAAADLLVREHILAATSTAFTHPVVQHAILADLGPHLRSAEHARAAELLAAHRADPERVAAHVLATEPVGSPAIAALLHRAAGQAMARGAPATAAEYLRRAVAEPGSSDEQPDLLRDLGLAEGALQRPESVLHLEEAFELAPPGPRRAAVGLDRARLLAFAGLPDAAHAAATAARIGLGPEDRELSLFLDALEMMTSNLAGGSADVAPWIERFGSFSGSTPAERSVLAALAFGMAKIGSPKQGIRSILDRVISHGGCSFDAPDGFSPLTVLSTSSWVGDYGRSLDLSTRLVTEAQRAGSVLSFTQAIAMRAVAHVYAGHPADAVADARTAVDAMDPQFAVTNPIAHFALVSSLLDLGETAQALACAQQFSFSAERGDPALAAVARCAHGRALLEAGDPDGALHVLEAAGEVLDSIGTANVICGPWRPAAALALAALGRPVEAREVLRPGLETARTFGDAWGIAACLRAAAVIDHAAAEDHLRQALDVVEASDALVMRAAVLIELGAALRRRGQRRAARDLLVEGHRVANECAALPLAHHAGTELLALGTRPRRVPRTGRDTLTGAERRVAELVAGGSTNRETAQRLFVTEKTVEKHLGNVYLKLGIRSRNQLRGRLDSEQ